MKKLILNIVAMMMVLSLAACSTKTEYVYIKPKPFLFQSIQLPKSREIRVHSKDIKLYEAYINNFRNVIQFHNEQIRDYKETFVDKNSTKE